MLLSIGCAIIISPLLYLIYIYINHIMELKQYPPGPFPLPLIGNLHQFGKEPHKTMMKLRVKYGDVFSVSLGTKRIVIVNSIEAAREALISKLNAFSGRPQSYPLEITSRGFISLVFADFGPLHTRLNKLGHSAIKMFGEGTVKIQTIAKRESEYLHKRLKESCGYPVDLNLEFGLTCINILSQLMLGNRYTKDDEEYKLIMKSTELQTQGLDPANLEAYFPWLCYLPLESLKKLRLGCKLRDEFYGRKLREHKSTYNPNQVRDCLDAFLRVKMNEENESADFCNLTDDNIEMTMNSIMDAGSETVTITLRWMILYLLHWPQYQDEMYEEIKTNVGSDRYPDMNDRNNLHLTQAFISEVLRYSSITPFGLPRKTIEDTNVAGCFVPKDTQVLINVWSIHHDPKHWEDPEMFNPRRFFNEKEKYINASHKSFLPFSAGRRSCFGETIAKLELFLIFSRLIRDFKFYKSPEGELPCLEAVIGVVSSPHSFNAMFTLRKDHLIT